MRLPVELKTIQACATRYPASLSRRCEAVERRAAGIATEYEQKLRRLDERLGSPPEAGPLLAKLRSFPPVVPLVVGAFAELNAEFDELVGTLAQCGAAENLRHIGAPSRAAATGTLAWLYRRRIGFVALRGQARLKLDGLRYAGADGAARARETTAARLSAAAQRLCARSAWRRRISSSRADFGPW